MHDSDLPLLVTAGAWFAVAAALLWALLQLAPFIDGLPL